MTNSVSIDQIDVNARLLVEDWIAEIDAGIGHMVPVVKRVFRPDGFLGLIADPLIDLAAISFLKSSRKTGLKQMDITIRCAKEAIKTGKLVPSLQNHMKKYVELDEMFVYGKKNHPRFGEMKSSIQQEFALRVEESTWLLSASPREGRPINSAPDIYKIAYEGDVNKAKEVHARELGFIEERLRTVREQDGLVVIPFGLHDKVLQVVAEGLQFTKDRYVQVFARWFA